MSGNPFEDLAEHYDAWFEGEGRRIFEIELAALKEAAQGLPRPWLEVGVGSGRFAEALGIDLGIDPSRKLLELAKGRGVRAIYGRGETLPFRDGSFGAAFLIVTLCFVEDPEAVLQECHRVLKPEGSLVVGLVPREGPWGRRYQAQSREGHPFYSHARFYSTQELKNLLFGAGFQIERLLSTLLQPPGGVRELEAPREGYHPNAGFVVVVAQRRSYACQAP